MRVLVLSDTHIPRAAQDLPKEVYDEIEKVDMIIHAGDFVEKDLYDKLKVLKPIAAVYGNMDPAELRRILKERDIVEIGKFRVGLIHGFGAPKDLINTVKGQFTNVDAIIFGHAHAPINVTRDGVLLFNPGSPTDKIYASVNSYGILEIGDKISASLVKIQ